MTDHSAASFGAALRQLIDHLDSALEQAYRTGGLEFRPRYTPVVRALMAKGPQTIRALAQRLGVSHSAASQTVSQMSKHDLLSISTGTDARQRIVQLSDKAVTLLPRLEQHWRAATVATAVLDAETGGNLVTAVNRANAALAARSFGDRLQHLDARVAAPRSGKQ